MIKLLKRKDKDFVVVCFSDPQISSIMWENKTHEYLTFTDTVLTLLEETKPDMVIVMGDNCPTGDFKAYEFLGKFFNSFDIPFAIIFGNHDYNEKYEIVEKQADILTSFSNCLFEKGDRELGIGNYVITINDQTTDNIIEGFIFMDTHDKAIYTDKFNSSRTVFSKINGNQLSWYQQQVKGLNKKGCKETSVFCHIPIFAFNKALQEYLKPNIIDEVTKWKSSLSFDWSKCNRVKPIYPKGSKNVWKEGTKVIGEFNEYGGNYPEDDNMFKLIKELDSTRNVFSAHNHLNSYSVVFKGVRLTQCLKTGTGCYFADGINGGTIITIGNDGVKSVFQKYVDIDEKFINDIYKPTLIE